MVPTVGATELAITSVSSRHDVRERGRQRGQEEPVDAQHRQHADVQRHPEAARGHQGGGQGHERGPQQADQTRICRRDQRSMNTPANGPISEYGR